MINTRRLNNQGMTAIEVITAVTIAGIIMAAISTFMIVHLMSYKKTQEIVNIQYDAQVALNQMSEVAMESQGIVYIKNSANLMDITTESQPGIIIFKDDEPDTYHIYTQDTTKLNFKDRKLYYDKQVIADINSFTSALPENVIFGDEVARNVKLFCTPAKGSDASMDSFKTSDGIEILLMFQNDDINSDFKTLATYRNKD